MLSGRRDLRGDTRGGAAGLVVYQRHRGIIVGIKCLDIFLYSIRNSLEEANL
jgi:hypothetical protein